MFINFLFLVIEGCRGVEVRVRLGSCRWVLWSSNCLVWEGGSVRVG